MARFRNLNGDAQYEKPRWNGDKSTFARKGDAQRPLDDELGQFEELQALGAYFKQWLSRHSRSERSNKISADRVGYVLNVAIDGRPCEIGSSTSCVVAMLCFLVTRCCALKDGRPRGTRHLAGPVGDGQDTIRDDVASGKCVHRSAAALQRSPDQKKRQASRESGPSSRS